MTVPNRLWTVETPDTVDQYGAPHAWVTSHGSLILGELDPDGESCVAPLTIIAAGHWISCTQEDER